MPARILTPPGAEPLHLDEVKAQLRIQHTQEDALLLRAITSAREYWEDLTARALIAQTVQVALPSFPYVSHSWQRGQWFIDTSLILPRTPARSISSITYVDPAGIVQTLSAATYTLDTFSEPHRIVPTYGEVWPSTRCQVNAVVVTYVAGYATPFTVNAGTEVLTLQGRAPVLNEVVRLWNSGGSLPSGLSINTDYYVVNVSGQTCKLSLTQGGAAVDITTAGAGLHYAGEIPRPILDELKLWIGDSYEHREGMGAPARKFLLSQNYRLYGVA